MTCSQLWQDHYKRYLAPLIASIKNSASEETSFLKFQLRLRLTKAERLFTEAMASGDEAAADLTTQSELAVILGDLKRYEVLAGAVDSFNPAIDKYLFAIQLDPVNQKAFNQLAVVFMIMKKPLFTAALLVKSYLLENPCLDDLSKLLNRLAAHPSRIDDVTVSSHRSPVANLCMNLNLRLAQSVQDPLDVFFPVDEALLLSPVSAPAVASGSSSSAPLLSPGGRPSGDFTTVSSLGYRETSAVLLCLLRKLPSPPRSSRRGHSDASDGETWVMRALESLLAVALITDNALLVYLVVGGLLTGSQGVLRAQEVRAKLEAAKFTLPAKNNPSGSLSTDFLITFDGANAGSGEGGAGESDRVARSRIRSMLSGGRTGTTKQLAVLDGLNVALAHGQHASFSIIGLMIAKNFFEDRGFDVIICLPRPMARAFPGKARGGGDYAKKTPMDILDFFEGEQQKILLTPPQDYDDGYTLELARRRNGVIVSNDKFRDFIAREKDKAEFKRWLDQRLCSFAFVGDEFIPNPEVFR